MNGSELTGDTVPGHLDGSAPSEQPPAPSASHRHRPRGADRPPSGLSDEVAVTIPMKPAAEVRHYVGNKATGGRDRAFHLIARQSVHRERRGFFLGGSDSTQ